MDEPSVRREVIAEKPPAHHAKNFFCHVQEAAFCHLREKKHAIVQFCASFWRAAA
jgi:hypothetical protein